MSRKLTLPSKLNPLTSGSYEELTSKLERKIVDESSKIFGNSSERIKVVGTFKNHVIVVDESAKFARVMYETADVGDIVITGFKPLDIPVFETSDRYETADFVNQQSSDIADVMLGGNKLQATEMIRDLMRVSPGDREFSSSIRVNNRVAALTPMDSFYKTAAIFGISESFDITTNPESKYTRLGYDHDMANSGPVREMAESDLTNLIEKYEDLSNQVSSIVATLGKVSENTPVTPDNHNEEMVVFMNAFINEISESQAVIAASLSEATSTSALGQLYDLMAERFFKQSHVFRQISNAALVEPHASN